MSVVACVHPEGRRERGKRGAWFSLHSPDVLKRVAARRRQDDIAFAIGNDEFYVWKFRFTSDAVRHHVQVGHELSKRNRLVPDLWNVSVAFDNLAGTKTEEMCAKVFTHIETVLPRTT
jgi:hypothetical protein